MIKVSRIKYHRIMDVEAIHALRHAILYCYEAVVIVLVWVCCDFCHLPDEMHSHYEQYRYNQLEDGDKVLSLVVDPVFLNQGPQMIEMFHF